MKKALGWLAFFYLTYVPVSLLVYFCLPALAKDQLIGPAVLISHSGFTIWFGGYYAKKVLEEISRR
jgi:hypothetical protein